MSAFDLSKANYFKRGQNVPASKLPAFDVPSNKRLETKHPMMLHRDTVRQIFIDNPKLDVNCVDPESGVTLFHVACEFGFVDVVERLLARHAAAPREFDHRPVDARDELGNTPLHLALRHAHPDNRAVAKLLLRAGADPDAADRYGSTALHTICKRDYDTARRLAQTLFKICQDVLGRAPRVDTRDKWGRTPLEWAVQSRTVPLLEVLLEHSHADLLSGFVFPYPNYYDVYLKPRECESSRDFIARIDFATDCVLKCLKRRGWVTKEEDPAKIKLIYRRYGLTKYATPNQFEKSKKLYAYSGPRQA
ncbi:hypothetical protein TKK_0002300 [Trichogramma kaykai]